MVSDLDLKKFNKTRLCHTLSTGNIRHSDFFFRTTSVLLDVFSFSQKLEVSFPCYFALHCLFSQTRFDCILFFYNSTCFSRYISTKFDTQA